MRRALVVVAVGLVLSACASENPTVNGGGSGGGVGPSSSSCSPSTLHLFAPARLTVATDSPAYNPWFRHNDPSNGEGYESAVTYAVADQLGFSNDQVHWVVQPFGKTFAPGPKDYDFAIEQISITPERSQAVTFSVGYYDDQQALLAIKGTPIANATTLADLKPYKYGAEIGTTSLAFISQDLQPTQQPAVFDTTAAAISALENGQIDGMVLDLPTAAYTQYAIKNGTLVGKFAPAGEQFGMAFEKGNPLVTCVNQAIETLKSNGTLDQLQKRWLASYNAVPLIE
jgi:polar amino acid transport system substrate-binding protein